MLTMLFTALFVEENRQMETKHSLVDTQHYRMLQTNGKRWVNMKILSQKHDVAHFRARPYFGHPRQQVRFAHLRRRKGPKTHGIDFVGIVMFHMCFRILLKNELCTKNAGSPEMLKQRS